MDLAAQEQLARQALLGLPALPDLLVLVSVLLALLVPLALLAPLVSTLGIGQLILEGVKGKQWVHVSTRTPEKFANRIITITDAGARVGIQVLA